MTKGLVDFGASDMPMTDEMLASSPVKLIHIPTVLGADVPAFNVPGVTDLDSAATCSPTFFWARSPTGMMRASPKIILA